MVDCLSLDGAEGPEKSTWGGVNESQSNFLMKTWFISQIRPDTLLFYLSQDHIAIEKLLVLGTGLGKLESQRKMTINASKVMCETSTTKIRQTKQITALCTLHRTTDVRDWDPITIVQWEPAKPKPLIRRLKTKLGRAPVVEIHARKLQTRILTRWIAWHSTARQRHDPKRTRWSWALGSRLNRWLKIENESSAKFLAGETAAAKNPVAKLMRRPKIGAHTTWARTGRRRVCSWAGNGSWAAPCPVDEWTETGPAESGNPRPTPGGGKIDSEKKEVRVVS
jgi:hypothetical protein